jgi:hypothetical protein
MAGTQNSNPWGVDQDKYYVSVGGLSSFLAFADTLHPQSKQKDSPEDQQLKMMREVSEA